MKRNLIATATVAACALMAVSASADEIINYNPISAIAGASYRPSNSPPCSNPVTFDTGFDYFGKQPDQNQIIAAAVSGPSQAGAALSAPNVAVAFANAEGGGVSCSSSGAAGILTGRTTIYDPQGRTAIKLKARFKAA